MSEDQDQSLDFEKYPQHGRPMKAGPATAAKARKKARQKREKTGDQAAPPAGMGITSEKIREAVDKFLEERPLYRRAPLVEEVRRIGVALWEDAVADNLDGIAEALSRGKHLSFDAIQPDADQ